MKPTRFAGQFAGLVLALVLAISCGGAPGFPSAEEILAAADEAQHKAGTAHFDVDMKITIKAEGMTVDATAKYVGDIMEPDRFKGTIEVLLSDLGITDFPINIDSASDLFSLKRLTMDNTDDFAEFVLTISGIKFFLQKIKKYARRS